MLKAAWFTRLPEGVDKGDAQRRRAKEAGAVPGLERYVESDALGPHPSVSGASEEKVFFDGYACAWFENRAALDNAMRSPEWEALVANELEWEHTEMAAVVEELELKPGPRSPFKAVWVLRFRRDRNRQWLRDFWSNEHAEFVLDAPGVDRYVQNHVVASLRDGGFDAIGFDGFAECWFKDRDAFLQAVTSPQWEGLVAEGAELFDMSFLWGAVLSERVVKESAGQLV
jgi:EthD domain